MYAKDGSNGSAATQVEYYNTSLVKTTSARSYLSYSHGSGGQGDKYFVMGGGSSNKATGGSGDKSDTVDLFNSSLVKSTADVLSVSRGFMGSTNLDNNIIFAGGSTDPTSSSSSANKNTIDIYQY